MIDLRSVTVRFGDRIVLDDVSVRLTERRIGVIGANGSGKSTLARLLNGLVLPSIGTVQAYGMDTRRQGRQVRQRVGFVFTDPDAQIVMPTVAEDLAFGLRRTPLSAAERDTRVRQTLRRLDLADQADYPAHLLSGGQKQLLAIAGVLIGEPATVVCDEPTTLLDLRNASRIGRVLAELEQQVIMVTHQLDLLADYERVLLVQDGRIRLDGDPASVIDAYRESMT